jgi:hypothetical protein
MPIRPRLHYQVLGEAAVRIPIVNAPFRCARARHCTKFACPTRMPLPMPHSGECLTERGMPPLDDSCAQAG